MNESVIIHQRNTQTLFQLKIEDSPYIMSDILKLRRVNEYLEYQPHLI